PHRVFLEGDIAEDQSHRTCLFQVGFARAPIAESSAAGERPAFPGGCMLLIQFCRRQSPNASFLRRAPSTLAHTWRGVSVEWNGTHFADTSSYRPRRSQERGL